MSNNSSKLGFNTIKHGQKILNKKLDNENFKATIEKSRLFVIENKNLFKIDFVNFINSEEAFNYFSFIEQEEALKQDEILDFLKFLDFRFNFRNAGLNKKIFDAPPYLLIEPVSSCNLRCPMCFQTDKSFTRKPFMGIMKLELFDKILYEADELNIRAITLASRGEPTMHPKFNEMLKKMSNYKSFLQKKINTNATYLDEKKCHAIFENNISTIVISGDHYEKEQYEKLRLNCDFDDVLKKVKLLYNIREKNYPNSKTEIRISGIDLYNNLDKEKFQKFWSQYSDNVTVSNAAERWDTYNNKIENDNLTSCHFLWDRMYIWFDGKCNPCDADYKSYLSYGDVTKNTIREIWNSKKINEHRMKHTNNLRNQLNPCNRCGIKFN